MYNLTGEPIPEIKRLEIYLKFIARSAKFNNTIHEKKTIMILKN